MRPPFATARFIVNPKSGPNQRPDEIVAAIHREWRGAGVDYEIVPTECRGHGRRLAAESAAAGTDLVVAVGGDGTVNEVASGVVATSAVLGVMPAGSGNGFARNFGVPLDPLQALQSLASPAVRSLDVGLLNGRHFFCGAGIGLDAAIAAGFDRFGARGTWPYFVVGLREFVRHRPEPIAVRFDDRELRGSPLLVYVANTAEYGSGATIAPGAVPDDGLLEICWLSQPTVLSALVNLRRLFDGTLNQWHAVNVFRTSRLTISRSDEGYLHTDGDPHWEAAVLEVSVLPRQLRMAVSEEWSVKREA